MKKKQYKKPEMKLIGIRTASMIATSGLFAIPNDTGFEFEPW